MPLQADELALRTVARAMGVKLLIVDDQARREVDKFVTIREDTADATEAYVVLSRTRRQHYNLVICAGSAWHYTLPGSVRRAFGIVVPSVNAGATGRNMVAAVAAPSDDKGSRPAKRQRRRE